MTQGHETKVSNFDAWYKNNYWQLSADIDEAKDTYKAGAASRQDEFSKLQIEIDQLQKRVKELELINFDSELHFDAAKEHIDHLQKRIEFLEKGLSAVIRKSGLIGFREIRELCRSLLKGESNE